MEKRRGFFERLSSLYRDWMRERREERYANEKGDVVVKICNRRDREFERIVNHINAWFDMSDLDESLREVVERVAVDIRVDKWELAVIQKIRDPKLRDEMTRQRDIRTANDLESLRLNFVDITMMKEYFLNL